MSVADSPPTVRFRDANRTLELAQVRAVWRRRPFRPLLPTIVEEDYRRFAQAEWMHALDAALDRLGGRVVNLASREWEATKQVQLDAARRVGLAVPATLISNCKEDVLQFVQEHPEGVIYKSASNMRGRAFDTRRFDEIAYSALYSLGLAPSIFQEQIVGDADIRVTIVDDMVFSAQIHTATGRADVDSRLDLDVPYEPCALEESVRSSLTRLMRDLGLSYGAVDLKVRKDGSVVFLEVNPQGQFLFVEIKTGLPISLGLASCLAGEERPHCLDEYVAEEITRSSRIFEELTTGLSS